MNDRHTRAANFLAREARVLEQRLYATLFEGAPATGVVEALRGYRNEDGGFGHGLEPDKRCPASQPLDAQVALETLVAAGTSDAAMLQGACDYLAGVGPDGGVPCVLPSIATYPRADHWGDGDFPPGLNPTAAIAGLLHALGVDHPWLDKATDFCWRELDREAPHDAHGLAVTFGFLEHVPDRRRAEALADSVAAQLPDAKLYLADADAEGYGLTPLAFAPTPDSRWGPLFDDAQIEAHLDRRARPASRRRLAGDLGTAERGVAARVARHRNARRLAHSHGLWAPQISRRRFESHVGGGANDQQDAR